MHQCVKGSDTSSKFVFLSAAGLVKTSYKINKPSLGKNSTNDGIRT